MHIQHVYNYIHIHIYIYQYIYKYIYIHRYVYMNVYLHGIKYLLMEYWVCMGWRSSPFAESVWICKYICVVISITTAVTMMVVGISCNFPNKPDYSFILLCNSSGRHRRLLLSFRRKKLPWVGERVGLQHRFHRYLPNQSWPSAIRNHRR